MGKLNEFRQLVVLLLLLILSFCYAMFQGGFVSWFLFYTIVPFFLYAILLKFIPIRIEHVERHISPSRLVRGKVGQVDVTLRIKSWIPLIYLTVQEIGESHLEKEKMMFFVGFRREFHWSYTFEKLPRGIYSFEGFSLQFHDLFGWMTRNESVECAESVIVYPNVLPLEYKPIQFKNEQGGESFKYSIMKDMTLVTGVRDYQSGDQFSRIHWKSFAKDETLRTKEFEERKSQRLMLVLDRSVNLFFDEMVDLSASIIQTIMKKRGEISFLSVGSTRFNEVNIKTEVQMEKILEHLALVQPDGNYSLDALLIKEEKVINGASLIIVTSYLSNQLKKYLMKQGGKMGIVCFVVGDRAQYEGIQKSIREFPQVKIVPLTEKMFQEAFTEVAKP